MLDYISMGADVALAAAAFVGTYYAIECSRLFRGDLIMEEVWRLATVAFVILAFFSVLDFVLTLANGAFLQYRLHITIYDIYDIYHIAAVFAIAVLAAAVMVLVRWGRSSTEPRTQQSGQYLQR